MKNHGAGFRGFHKGFSDFVRCPPQLLVSDKKIKSDLVACGSVEMGLAEIRDLLQMRRGFFPKGRLSITNRGKPSSDHFCVGDGSFLASGC
jgi:hypothetical protein